jgi:hypothetical protein
MTWQSMSTAPRDGTAIQVEIPGNGSDLIIAWFDDFIDGKGNPCGGWAFVEDQEPPACWTDGVCWESNADDQPSIQPARWKALGESM